MAARVGYLGGALTLGVLLAAFPTIAVHSQTAREAPRVPLVPGLTISAAIAHPSGDAEVIFMVQSVDADGYRMTFSFDGPDGAGPSVVRRVLSKDQRAARTMRNWYGANDPEAFPGTTPFFSGAIINDLRQSGRAALTLLVATSAATIGQTAVQELPGTLNRIEPGPVGVPMLVNGRMVDLPTIHAKADVGSGTLRRSADLYVLDDPDNPIILRWRDETRNSRLLKIDFPVTNSLERDLNERRSAEVYGLYFGFGSAALRPESERVLKDIADTLVRNPAWKLRIEGHTDGIGTDTANLELSRRRSAAVREALVGRFKIDGSRLSVDGKGESAPKATNDTPDGRAQNRRVELTRQ
jgi:outer membrane protein OmpA-like peptidoglycan-associated protein